MRSGFVFLMLVLCTHTAYADRSSQAREHYQSATSHFAVGEFAEAAAEYQAAYKLKPDPALLYNAAQSYRLANNPDKALILYKNYLQLYPNEPNADDVRHQIDKLKDAIAASERAKTSPPTGTTEPKQLPPTATEPTATPAPPPATHVEPAASATVVEHPTEGKVPVYKKWWLWTIVGVVVVGGVVTAAVLATRSNGSWSNAPDVGPGAAMALVRW